MKRFCAALFLFIFISGGTTAALVQHEGHGMAPMAAPQAPMQKAKVPQPRPQKSRPPSRPAKQDEALQPIVLHFERIKEFAGKVQMDFERLRTIDNPDELREAMRQYSLMLDQLHMMLIEHEAMLRDLGRSNR